jgi:hypothetical protein
MGLSTVQVAGADLLPDQAASAVVRLHQVLATVVAIRGL